MRSDFTLNTKSHFQCYLFLYRITLHRSPGLLVQEYCIPSLSLFWCPYMCVCVFSSHSFWTSSSLDVPAGATQEEGYTGLLIHLLSAVRAFIFLARRIQPFLSLVDREIEFCVLKI